MAVPKKMTSQSRRNMRRSHDALSPVNTGECSNCGAKKLPHHLCSSCGHYKGRLLVNKRELAAEGTEE